MLVGRLYPMLNLHEIAGADGGVLQVEIEAAAQELDRLLKSLSARGAVIGPLPEIDR